MDKEKIAKPHTLGEWIVATRPWSFSASVMPVVVSLTYFLWNHEPVDWLNGVLAVIGIVLFHAAGNTWSDYFDFKKGVDTPDSYSVPTLTGGMFLPRQVLGLSLGLLFAAILVGMWLLWRCGAGLLWIGFGGIACTLFYPMLKYRALGDLVIAVAYAWLPMWGTSLVAIGSIDMHVLLLAVPVGMLTVGILHANNTRDIGTDRSARIATLAMKLGFGASVRLYVFWIIGAFVFVAACVAAGLLPVWNILIFLCFPQGVAQVRRIFTCRRTSDVAVIAHLDEFTAKLQLQFSALFALSFIVAYFAS